MNSFERPTTEIEKKTPEAAAPTEELPEEEPTPESHPNIIRAIDLAREAEARTPKIQAEHRETSRAAMRERLLHEFGEDWISREALKRDKGVERMEIIKELSERKSYSKGVFSNLGSKLLNIGRDLAVVAEDEKLHPTNATEEEIERSLERFRSEHATKEKPLKIIPASKLRHVAKARVEIKPAEKVIEEPEKKRGEFPVVGNKVEIPPGFGARRKEGVWTVAEVNEKTKSIILRNPEETESFRYSFDVFKELMDFKNPPKVEAKKPEREPGRPEKLNIPNEGEWEVAERFPDGAVWINQGRYEGRRLEKREYEALKSKGEKKSEARAEAKERISDLEAPPIFMRSKDNDSRVERWQLLEANENFVVLESEHGELKRLTHDQRERLNMVQGMLRGEYRNQPRKAETPAVSEKAELHPGLKTGPEIGSHVTWESEHATEPGEPKRIEDITTAPDGRKFARLEDERNAAPIEELKVTRKKEEPPRIIEQAAEAKEKSGYKPPENLLEAVGNAKTFEDLYGMFVLSGGIEAIDPRTHKLEMWSPDRLKQMLDDLRFPHNVKWEAFTPPHKITKGDEKKWDENQKAWAEHLSRQMDRQVKLSDFPVEFGIQGAVRKVMDFEKKGTPENYQDKQEVKALDMEIGVATEALNAAKKEGRGDDAKKFGERIKNLEQLRDAKVALLPKKEAAAEEMNFDEALISGAKNFEELYKALEEIGFIEQKSGQEIVLPSGEKTRGYTPERLKKIIEAFRGNEIVTSEQQISHISLSGISARYIPDVYGLRKKAIELYRKESPMMKPAGKKTGLLRRILGIKQ